MLLNELWKEIIDDAKDINLSLVSQLWYNFNKNNVKKLYIDHFIKMVPDQIIDAFGGIETLTDNYVNNKYNLLKINIQHDYIDFISPNMMTSPIMLGIDPCHRRFFSIKYIDKFDKLHVVTLFQRYTTQKYWVGCGHYNKQHAFDININYDLLKKFIEDREITYHAYDEDRTIRISD